MNVDKKKLKKYVPALLLALAGVVLILLGGGRAATAAPSGAAEKSADAYRESLQERLEELCRKVPRAENAVVSVTLEGGYRTVYVLDAHGNPVSVGGQALAKEVLDPAVAGVGIVCPGADAALSDTLVSLVSTTLGLPSHRIIIVR